MFIAERKCVLELGVGLAIFFLLPFEPLIFCFSTISKVQMRIPAHHFTLLSFRLHVCILVSQGRCQWQYSPQYLTSLKISCVCPCLFRINFKFFKYLEQPIYLTQNLTKSKKETYRIINIDDI